MCFQEYDGFPSTSAPARAGVGGAELRILEERALKPRVPGSPTSTECGPRTLPEVGLCGPVRGSPPGIWVRVPAAWKEGTWIAHLAGLDLWLCLSEGSHVGLVNTPPPVCQIQCPWGTSLAFGPTVSAKVRDRHGGKPLRELHGPSQPACGPGHCYPDQSMHRRSFCPLAGPGGGSVSGGS